MKWLASFVMRGPSQAVMVTTVLALLSLILPLLGLLSTASVGLITLRQGVKSGLIVSALATVACALFMAIAFGNPLPSLGFLFLQWLPVVVLGYFLRSSRSLGLSLELALSFGVLVILGQYLMLGDPAEFWQQQLQPLVQHFEEAALLDKTQGEAVVAHLASWMGGVLAAGIFLQLVFSLMMGRWWQALLYNPGGFRDEFHGLRLHKIFGLIGLPAMVVMFISSQDTPEMLNYLGVLMMSILFLQGLAVVHGVLAKVGSGSTWLVVVYLLLIILLPQAVMVLVTLGLVDIWIDFRTRFERTRSAG